MCHTPLWKQLRKTSDELSWAYTGVRWKGDQTSPSQRISVLNIHCKDWCWSWNSNTLATWSFWTVMLKTLESPLDCKEIQPVHPEGNQSWIFIGRTYIEVETPILWPPDEKNWHICKDSDSGKDWRQQKGMREDEMVGWHHWLNRHEFEQALLLLLLLLWEMIKDREASVLKSMGRQRVRQDWVTEQQPESIEQSNYT